MASTVSLEVVGGPFVEIPWKAAMTAQDALEAAYNDQQLGPSWATWC